MTFTFFRVAVVMLAAMAPLASLAQVTRTIANLSVRARVDGTATGASMLAVNFTIEGATKTVLLRGAGPALGTFGVPGVLSDPLLRVYDGTGALLEANSGWSATLASAFANVGAFAWQTGSKDAALQLTLAPGTYTATMGSVSGSSGTVLLEVYDMQTTGRLAYVAARGPAGAGNDQLAPGFVVQATTPATMLARALGPALSAAGVAGAVANPMLNVFNGASIIATNDDWNGAGALSDAATAAGLMPLAAGSRDAATFVTAAQGNFVVQLSTPSGTGVGMVEVAHTEASRANFAPAILVPPQTLTLASGASAVLSALAVGKPAPAYQWRKDGVAIAGATTSSFALGSAQAGDAGTYSVALTNSVGTTIATIGTVNVVGGVTITTQPMAQVVVFGGTATFSVGAVGPGQLTYQWLLNGNAIPGATQPTLTVPNVSATSAGNYSVRITSGASTATSNAVALIITGGSGQLAILEQPRSQMVAAGGTATFSVTARGSGAVTYQWLRDGTPIAGATQASFTISPVTSTSAASYSVRVTDGTAIVTSAPAVLTVGVRSVAGTYFGTLGPAEGPFALLVREDGTGVFLGYTRLTRQGLLARDVRVDAARNFQFRATALGSVGPADYLVAGRITADGQVLGSITGITSNLFAPAPGVAQQTERVGFYEGGAPGAGAQAWAIVGSGGDVMSLTVSGTVVEAGRGAMGADGSASITNETGARTAGTLSGAVMTLVTTPFLGGATRSYFLANSDTRTDAEKLVNISTRSQTGSGGAALIAGFVVAGERAKPVLVRAVGPTLAGFGVGNPLAAVRLEVFRGQALMAVGTDWGAAANASEVASAAVRVGAFALPQQSRDAALLLTLEPGAYTAIVSGQTENATGVSLVEVYDASTGAAKEERIVNIATRGVVGSGDQTLIAGFVITGRVPKRVLVRGVGPTLAASFGVSGVLAQPRVTVLSGGTPAAEIATNTRWSAEVNAAELAAAAQAAGAFPLASGSQDAALIVNLAPGTYSAQVTNAAGGSGGGVALVEVYELR